MTISSRPAILSELHASALQQPGTPLQLNGMFNLRDLGGYQTNDGLRTRTGRIFRADSLAHLTDEDVLQIEQLGLRVICDLRNAKEIETLPNRMPVGARYEHNPMAMTVNAMADYRQPDFDWDAFRIEFLYIHMLDHSGDTFRRVFEHLAVAESYPYLFHCAAGKDRTGMTAALLLRTAGVPDQTIVADFALSDAHIAPKIPEFKERMRRRGVNPLGSDKVFRAPAEAMVAALAHLDEHYGSTAAYLAAIGVTEARVAAFREAFVE